MWKKRKQNEGRNKEAKEHGEPFDVAAVDLRNRGNMIFKSKAKALQSFSSPFRQSHCLCMNSLNINREDYFSSCIF